MATNNNSGLYLNYTVFNESNTDLIVRTNGGFNYIVPKLNTPTKEAQRVSLRIDFKVCPGYATIDPNTINPLDRKILEGLMEILIQRTNQHGKNSYISVEESFTVTLGNDLGMGNDYVSDLFGFTISLNDPAPLEEQLFEFKGYSNKATVSAMKQQVKGKDGNHLMVRLVDKRNRLPTLWMKFADDATELLKTKGSEPDGLYIVESNHERIVKETFISMEDLTEAKLNEHSIYYNAQHALQDCNSKIIQGLQSKVSSMSKDSVTLRDNLEQTERKNLDLQQEINLLKSESRVSKYESRLSTATSKAQIESLKEKADTSRFMSFFKVISGIGGVLKGFLKLFQLG